MSQNVPAVDIVNNILYFSSLVVIIKMLQIGVPQIMSYVSL